MSDMAEYYDDRDEDNSIYDTMLNNSIYKKINHSKNNTKKYIISCDSRYNKGQKLYYQEGYGFSIFRINATKFLKENANKIIKKLKYNNPKLLDY